MDRIVSSPAEVAASSRCTPLSGRVAEQADHADRLSTLPAALWELMLTELDLMEISVMVRRGKTFITSDQEQLITCLLLSSKCLAAAFCELVTFLLRVNDVSLLAMNGLSSKPFVKHVTTLVVQSGGFVDPPEQMLATAQALDKLFPALRTLEFSSRCAPIMRRYDGIHPLEQLQSLEHLVFGGIDDARNRQRARNLQAPDPYLPLELPRNLIALTLEECNNMDSRILGELKIPATLKHLEIHSAPLLHDLSSIYTQVPLLEHLCLRDVDYRTRVSAYTYRRASGTYRNGTTNEDLEVYMKLTQLRQLVIG